MYALDSLRQLARKFLEKGELGNYQFQKDFLKPFEIVMTQNSNPEIRELVLRCMENMILNRVRNIKSGWKSVFSICSFAAGVADEHIVVLGFDIVSMVMTKHLELVQDFFVDVINCLISFSSNKPRTDISVKAVGFVRDCALKLIRGEIPLPVHTPERADEVCIKMWFPILTGLSRLVSSDSRYVPQYIELDYSLLMYCAYVACIGWRSEPVRWKYFFMCCTLMVTRSLRISGILLSVECCFQCLMMSSMLEWKWWIAISHGSK
jgi:hypothetical protein